MSPPDDPDDDEDTDRRRPTATELRRHRRTVPGGIPVLAEPPGDQPERLDVDWPITPDRVDAEILRRGGRDPDDPVRPAEVSAIVRQLAARMREEWAAAGVDRLRDIVEGTPDRPGLVATVASHAQVIGPARSAASWALRGTIAAMLVVGGFLYWRGRDEQHVIDELAAVKKDNERLERAINQLLNPNSKDPRP